jgi:hypothetical protein
MSIEGLVFAVFLTTLVLIMVGLPLTGRAARRPPADVLTEKQRERLLVYYERVLRNIHDLDEDHALGKLVASDYQQERELWAARGVQVLKALDTLGNQPIIAPSAAEDSAVDRAIDEAIETAVRDVRRASQPDTEQVIE